MVAGETIILGSFLGSYIFAYLAMNTREEHAPLRLFYHIMTFLWFYTSLGMGVNAIENGGVTADMMVSMFSSFSWVLYLVVAYFFIYLLWKALNDMFLEA